MVARNELRIGTPYFLDNDKSWELGVITEIGPEKNMGSILIQQMLTCYTDKDGSLVSIPLNPHAPPRQHIPRSTDFKKYIKFLPHPDELGK